MDRRAILFKLGLFCTRKKWLTLALYAAVTIIMGYFAFHLEINLGMLTLLDKNDPEVQKVHYANSNFGGMDYTFLAVSADTVYDAKRFSDELETVISKSDMVLRVVHKIDTDALLKYGFLFLEPNEIEDFSTFISENQTDFIDMFQDVHTVPFLTAFNKMLEKEIIEKDEISDTEDAMDRLKALDAFITTMEKYLEQGKQLGPYRLKKSLRDLFLPAKEDEDAINDEYMLSKDGKTVLMLVMPSEPGDDMIFTSKIMAFLEETIGQIGPKYPGAHVYIAGNVPIMRDEHQAILRDTKLSTVVTFVLVLLIFFFFFRKFSDLALITICLATGILWTYGVTYFYIGFLGVTTAFFSAILLGLGIDFAIHIITRYAEFIAVGDPVDKAVAKAMAGAGPGIITGSLTTSAAFYVLMICRFKGISQLGFVAGTGILSMMIIMFTLLPALIAFRDARKSSKRKSKEIRELFILSSLATYMVRHRRPAILVILILTIIFSLAATRIRFNYDFRSLEPRGGQAVEANKKLEEAFGKSIDYGLVFSDTVEQSREFANLLRKKESLVEVRDISEFIPLDQESKAPLIRKILPALEPVKVGVRPANSNSMDAQGIRDLGSALTESRRMVLAIKQLAIVGGEFELEDKCTQTMKNTSALASKVTNNPDSYLNGGGYYQYILGGELTSLLDNLKQAAKAKLLGVEELPVVVRANFIGEDGRFLVYAYPKGYIWTQDMLGILTADLRSVTENSTSIGILFLQIVNKMKLDFKSAIWLSLAMVFLLVFADFRRLATAVMALVPLVLGAVWMVGTMVILGLSFNLINVAVVPLIIGIGIDNGVHVIHRYRSEPKDKIQMAVQHTGRAIFLSSITTMAGFGSLGLASYVAVATLGWVLVIGVVYCLLTSVVVLPIILSLLEKRIGRV